MTSMRDFADKSYLTDHTTEESTFEKVAAVIGLFSVIIAVGCILFYDSVAALSQ
jgi:hypothetical protein